MSKKRVIALMTAIAVLFVMLFSAVYIVKNSRHDCCGGEHCQICYNIGVCRNAMKTVSATACVVCIFAAASYALYCAIQCSIDNAKSVTLISQKVELLN